jgi:hypothetical protein
MPVAAAAAPPSPSEPLAVVAETTRKTLEAAKRANTPLGAIALELARNLADGGHTAAGLAALSKELRATLDAALAGAPIADDEVDELAARRVRKAAGA